MPDRDESYRVRPVGVIRSLLASRKNAPSDESGFASRVDSAMSSGSGGTDIITLTSHMSTESVAPPK